MLQLHGHVGTVHALAFSADGQTLVSGGRDHSVRIWDVGSGCERQRLDGHGGPVLSLALHPNGRALATGGADCALKIWNLASGALAESYPRQMAAVTGVAWLPGKPGSLMMACGERLKPDRGGELCLWNFASQPRVQNIRLDSQGFWSLAVAGNQPTVAWGGGARNISAWNISHQKPKSFRQSAGSLGVALSPDGSLLASAQDRFVKLWDVNKGQERETLEGHKGMIRTMAFSPDGRWLATGSQDQTVRFWAIHATGSQAGLDYSWPLGGVHALALSPDGMLAAAAGETGVICIWDLDH